MEDRLLAKADPSHRSAHESMTFQHGEKGDHPLPVYQPEISSIKRDGNIREVVE